ncbi:MAG: FmdB family zinc ribbon protein [Acidobacteriaceae bacterium]
MPLYEYECTSCHRLTEKIQKFSDPELSVCPHCGGRLERTVTAAAVTFKGGGWYKDLYTSPRPSGSSSESSNGENQGDGSGGKEAPAPGSAGSAEGSKPAAAATAAPAPAAAATSATAPATKA